MLTMLPNGYLDGTDLFNYAELDELRGAQQNYLANADLVVGNIGHLPKILADMLLSLQTREGLKWKGDINEAIYKLSAGDLETILIKVRENTYGPRFYFEAECDHCKTVNKNLRLDLDKLEVQPMSIEDRLQPKVVVLPKMNVEVELKPIYLKDLFDLIKISNNKKDKLITSMACVSIKRLGTKSPVDEKDVGTIPASDLYNLQKQMEDIKLEGGIDTDIEVTCNNCQKDFTAKLNCYDSLFFDPTKGSMSSNT